MEGPEAPPGLPRRKKWRTGASGRGRYAAAHRWLTEHPVACAIAASTDLAAGNTEETRNLYQNLKREPGSGRAVSYPVFRRTLAALLSQPSETAHTRLSFAVWKPTDADAIRGRAGAGHAGAAGAADATGNNDWSSMISAAGGR